MNITLTPSLSAGDPSKIDAEKMTKRVKDGIESAWNGKWKPGCGCDVKFSANVKFVSLDKRRRDKGKGRIDYEWPRDDNVIFVVDQDARDNVWWGMDHGVWSQRSEDWVYAHEAGHLMGLQDEYRDKDGKSVAFPGREGHIMAEYNGLTTQDEINAIIGDRCPTSCKNQTRPSQSQPGKGK